MAHAIDRLLATLWLGPATKESEMTHMKADSVMHRWILTTLLLLLSCTASAAGPGAVRKQIESSMLVTGWILIAPDGSTTKVELDEKEKLPKSVVSLVERAGASWRFEPVLVDGKARKAKARMSVRIVAKKIEADRYEIAIRSGYFGEEAMTPEERIERPDSLKPIAMKPPSYPMSAMEMGARGTVYVVLKIGREGTVEELFAEQVNLQVIGSESEMARMRDLLARSVLKAAKQWTFQPPTVGEQAKEEAWVVRVPVEFQFHGYERPVYGQWDSYVPGPTLHAPWDTGFDGTQSPDAMIAGVLYDARNSLRLLTPLHPG